MSKNKITIYLFLFIISALVTTIFFNHLINQTTEEIKKKNKGNSSKPIQIQEEQYKRNKENNIKKPEGNNRKESEYYIITSNTLNIRKSNNVNSECIGMLYKNDFIEIIDKIDDWYKTKDNEFVNKNYLKIVNEDNFIRKQKNVSRSLFIRRPISIVNSKSNLHIEDLKKLLSKTKLVGIEEAILKAEQQYEINAFFILAVARLESGDGNSQIARNKNNLFGLNAVDNDPYNKAFTFKSKSESVYSFAKLIKKYYIGKNLKTVEQINTKYSSSVKWSNKIYRIMLNDYQTVKKLN